MISLDYLQYLYKEQLSLVSRHNARVSVVLVSRHNVRRLFSFPAFDRLSRLIYSDQSSLHRKITCLMGRLHKRNITFVWQGASLSSPFKKLKQHTYMLFTDGRSVDKQFIIFLAYCFETWLYNLLRFVCSVSEVQKKVSKLHF